jgi:uncharacterized membrane protein
LLASLYLLQVAVSVPTPSFLVQKETLSLAFLFSYVVLAVMIAIIVGAPFGYLATGRVLLKSFIVIFPTPIVFGLFSTWPAARWVPLAGYVLLVSFFCAGACFTHRLKNAARALKTMRASS